jgi:hypothetical protein
VKYRFTVSYEGEIEAPDPDSARTWAAEEVDAGLFAPSIVEVEPVTGKDEHGERVPGGEHGD